MRFLADVGVSVSIAEMLREHGHDVLHLSEQSLHRLPDDEILVLARRDGRVILTFDLDFGDLLAAGSHSLPSVILFRLHDQTPPSVAPRLLAVISERRRISRQARSSSSKTIVTVCGACLSKDSGRRVLLRHPLLPEDVPNLLWSHRNIDVPYPQVSERIHDRVHDCRRCSYRC